MPMEYIIDKQGRWNFRHPGFSKVLKRELAPALVFHDLHFGNKRRIYNPKEIGADLLLRNVLTAVGVAYGELSQRAFAFNIRINPKPYQPGKPETILSEGFLAAAAVEVKTDHDYHVIRDQLIDSASKIAPRPKDIAEKWARRPVAHMGRMISLARHEVSVICTEAYMNRMESVAQKPIAVAWVEAAKEFGLRGVVVQSPVRAKAGLPDIKLLAGNYGNELLVHDFVKDWSNVSVFNRLNPNLSEETGKGFFVEFKSKNRALGDTSMTIAVIPPVLDHRNSDDNSTGGRKRERVKQLERVVSVPRAASLPGAMFC